MKLLIFFILMFNISLFAQDKPYKRIYITYSLNYKHIESIYQVLNKLNFPIYVKEQNNKYIIYSKKYFNDDLKINNDLKIIKIKFKNARITMHNNKLATDDNLKLQSTFKINLSIGSSNIKSKPSYEVEFAYLFNKNLSLSLSYIYSSQNILDINNYATTLNYTFYPREDISILFGLMGGVSSLIYNNQQNAEQSLSTSIGLKNKIAYIINDNFDIFIQYNSLYFEHILIDSSSSNTTFNYLNNVTIGIGMRF